jgi:uncharacterized protein YlzI (FlbEa/FlbD family)
MKFIKLILAGSEKEVYINQEHIGGIINSPSVTLLELKNGKTFNVKETVEEILTKISDYQVK